MGLYINVPGHDKVEWLESNATEITLDEFNDCEGLADTAIRVVAVDNGIFTAAGVAYDEREAKSFTDRGDDRPKRFFIAKKEAIKPYCDAWHTYMKE